MITTPFEVVRTDHGYTWRLIGPCGRALVYTQEVYPTDIAAADAAKAERNRYSDIAQMRDAA